MPSTQNKTSSPRCTDSAECRLTEIDSLRNSLKLKLTATAGRQSAAEGVAKGQRAAPSSLLCIPIRQGCCHPLHLLSSYRLSLLRWSPSLVSCLQGLVELTSGNHAYYSKAKHPCLHVSLSVKVYLSSSLIFLPLISLQFLSNVNLFIIFFYSCFTIDPIFPFPLGLKYTHKVIVKAVYKYSTPISGSSIHLQRLNNKY